MDDIIIPEISSSKVLEFRFDYLLGNLKYLIYWTVLNKGQANFIIAIPY